MTDSITCNLCSPLINSKNAAWESVLDLGKKKVFMKNSMVIGNGALIDQLYYLKDGRLRLSKIIPDGSEKIVWYLEKGNLFGEVPFWDKKPMDGIFVAMEECCVYSFTRECIERIILVKYPELTANMLVGMANKARVLAIQASDITSLKQRVCKLLIYIVEREYGDVTAGRISCTLGLSQQELAGLLGVHRVTLNHVLTQLKREGIVDSVGKRKVIISDYSRLLNSAFSLVSGQNERDSKAGGDR